MGLTSAAKPAELADVPRSALPRHIAVIMDGNGRWARQRNLPRIEGHRHAIEAVRATVTECARLGIECLTLYSFSQENWKRPIDEVQGLMALCATYLARERGEILGNNIRLRQIGHREGLPPEVLRELDETQRRSAANTGLTLCLALNYGSRTELIDGVRSLARRVRDGTLEPEEIDEQALSDALYTTGLPDPDLLIRTAGEMRVSNFLLWQISYAELYVTPVLWPDFRAANLHEAIREFARRERRYGDVKPATPPGGSGNA
jgi:undecaprenyl diphosphate synthase